jgi:hypothetical protein
MSELQMSEEQERLVNHGSGWILSHDDRTGDALILPHNKGADRGCYPLCGKSHNDAIAPFKVYLHDGSYATSCVECAMESMKSLRGLPELMAQNSVQEVLRKETEWRIGHGMRVSRRRNSLLA